MKPSRWQIKFDTGADGFLKMIFVLGILAVVVVICGLVFLTRIYPTFWTGVSL